MPLGYVGLGWVSLGYAGLGDVFVLAYFGFVATLAPYALARPPDAPATPRDENNTEPGRPTIYLRSPISRSIRGLFGSFLETM